jgi:peptide/nickel transport system substrate-binding protein
MHGRNIVGLLIVLLAVLFLTTCARRPDASTLVMIIESSPLNLDPRVGTDAQSERLGELIYDALVHRDEHFLITPALAQSWEIPDPQTYIFHLRHDVRFHDGRPLTSRDVKWTFDSVMSGKLRTPKTTTYVSVSRVDAPDDYTVVFHLNAPFSTLLFNVSNGAIGIVPYGAGEDFARHPIGSGPFRLISNITDKEVVMERNDRYWGGAPQLERIRFNVVPDTTTRALELRKGSADLAMNALTADMIVAIKKSESRNLIVEIGPGTTYTYICFNLRDPILRDVRVRQAIALAIDRAPMIHYIWRDLVEPATSVLPPQHWAFNAALPQELFDPERARSLLDAAGFPAGKDGIRFHLLLKTTPDEWNRLLAAVLQQQLRAVGIALDIRTGEFASFYADVLKGQFQLFTGLRWTGGGNQDPDIFEYCFDSSSFPPRRANRGFYSNPEVDALLAEGRRELDREKRKQIYARVQEILNRDLPYVHLWYFDTVLVHSPRVALPKLTASGTYDFLRTASLQ